MIFDLLIILLMAIVGGIIFRWRGGGEHESFKKFMPRPVDQILFSSPYIFIAYSVLDVYLASLVSILTVVAVSKGHGKVYDLGTAAKPSTPFGNDYEFYDPWIHKLYNKLSPFWYDAIGLAITGLVYTLPLGVMLLNPIYDMFLPALLLGLSGALKSPCYMLGLWFHRNHKDLADLSEFKFNKFINLAFFTEWGEFFTGFILYACAGWFIIAILY
jgi:hypothetical protein